MAKNKNFTAAARKLFLEIKKNIKEELSKEGVSSPTGNDKQFKGLLKAIESVILCTEEGTAVFSVDVKKSLNAVTLITVNKKSVLEKERKNFISNVHVLVAEYRKAVEKSSKEPVFIESITIKTVEELCLCFSKRGLISDSILAEFKRSSVEQVATA